MKKINLFLILTFTAMAPCVLTGCLDGYHLHQQALGSLDKVKVNEKGVSYIDEGDQSDLAWDVGYMVIEGFLTGGGKLSNVRNPEYHGINAWNEEGYKDADAPVFDPVAMSENKKGSLFYLSEGLDFMNKRTRQTSQGYTTTVSLYYLQLPILANYGYQLGNGNIIHAGFGPYAAAGLFGKIKGDAVNQSVKFGSSANDDFKRMDYGLTFNAGFRFLRQFDATIGYDLGLRNVSTTPPDPDTKISGFSLKLGYWFH